MAHNWQPFPKHGKWVPWQQRKLGEEEPDQLKLVPDDETPSLFSCLNGSNIEKEEKKGIFNWEASFGHEKEQKKKEELDVPCKPSHVVEVKKKNNEDGSCKPSAAIATNTFILRYQSKLGGVRHRYDYDCDATVAKTSIVETFQASIKCQIRLEVVKKVFKNPRVTGWNVGFHPHKCIYKSDGVFLDYSVSAMLTNHQLGEMSSRAIKHFNMTKGTDYVLVAPLRAYYKKSGPSRHFDVRFKASLSSLMDVDNVDDTEIFEAKLKFVEETPCGPWMGGGGRLLSVSQGEGSIF